MSQTTVESWKSIEKNAAHLELGRQLECHAGAAVFEARQLDVDRQIHVRVCPLGKSGLGTTPEQVRATVAKLRTLSHPGLPKIYGGGTADGMAYLETEPVRGMWPDELAAKRRLSPRQKLELVIQLCESLAYVNSQGIRYGALVPRGVLVQRQLGSLRLEPKLVRFESMRAFKSDGADQRAFGEFLTTLLGSADYNDSDLDRKLRGLATKCADTIANVPTFAEMLMMLRPLLVEQTASAASPAIHLAEPLRVEIPQPRAQPVKNGRTERWKVLATSVVGTIVTLVLAITIADNSPNRGATPSRVGMRTQTYEPSPPTVRWEHPASRHRSTAPSDVSEDDRPDSMFRERTYHFMSSRRHTTGPVSSGLPTAEFARPRSWGSELEEDAFALSKPTWAKGTFGAPALTVKYSSAADLSNNPQIVWIIESNGVPQYEAHLFSGISGKKGELKGELRTISTGRLEPPLTTYLAEDPIGFGEPRRVSNILTIPEASEE